MRSQLKSFVIYGSAIFFSAALSFATFSVLTHHLSADDFGVVNLYNSFTIFLSPFIAVGVQYALGIDYFKLDEKDYRQHFTNGMFIPLVTMVLFTLLFMVFSSYILKVTNTSLFFVLTLPAACFLALLYDIFLNLFRNKEKHYLFAGVSIFKSVTEVGLTLLLVLSLGWKWEGRLASYLLTLVIVCLVIAFFISKWKLLTGRLEKGEIRRVFWQGLPFVPERLSIFVLGYSDRFFIDHFKTTADVGYYGAGAQMAVILHLVTLTLNNTFYPQMFKAMSGEKIDYAGLKKATLTFAGVSFFLTGCVMASIPVFFKLFIGPEFQEGKRYAYLLTAGMFIWALYNVLLPYLLHMRKNRVIMFISILGMLLSISLNFLLVPRLGALGATFTSIGVYFFMTAALAYFVHRFYGFRRILSAGNVGRKAETQENTEHS